MELNNSFPKKQKQIPPAGLTLGMCYSIIDLGTQQEQFPGKPLTSARKLHYSFELPSLPQVVFDEKRGPQPQAVFQEYTSSLNEKSNLAKVLMSWGNLTMEQLKQVKSEGLADFLKAYLGAPCMVAIVHNEAKTAIDETTGKKIVYAKIGQGGLSILPRMPEIPKPAGTINPVLFLDLDKFDWATFDRTPKFVQEKIMKSKEWAGIVAKYPKPATTMAQDLGYTQNAPQAGYVQQNGNNPVVNPAAGNHLGPDGRMYDQRGNLVQQNPVQQQGFEQQPVAPVVTNGPSVSF